MTQNTTTVQILVMSLAKKVTLRTILYILRMNLPTVLRNLILLVIVTFLYQVTARPVERPENPFLVSKDLQVLNPFGSKIASYLLSFFPNHQTISSSPENSSCPPFQFTKSLGTSKPS